jgi:hypothetical protein
VQGVPHNTLIITVAYERLRGIFNRCAAKIFFHYSRPYTEEMDMDLIENWNGVKRLFRDSFKTSFHYSIATVTDKGEPHVTPIVV